jgi:hypothetical protein
MKELETKCKNKNVRNICQGTNESKEGCLLINLSKDGNFNLAADSQNNLNRWKMILIAS